MDKPISKGDLVMVVGHRCCATHLGLVYRVTLIAAPQGWRCSECGQVGPSSEVFCENDDWSFFPSELKRIPPLDELEGREARRASRSVHLTRKEVSA